MTSQQKFACMTIIDLHLMFFMHALMAILASVDEGMAVADSQFDWRGRDLEVEDQDQDQN